MQDVNLLKEMTKLRLEPRLTMKLKDGGIVILMAMA